MTGTAAQKVFTPRFVRKTSLQPGERNTNFLMLDNEIAAAVIRGSRPDYTIDEQRLSSP